MFRLVLVGLAGAFASGDLMVLPFIMSDRQGTTADITGAGGVRVTYILKVMFTA